MIILDKFPTHVAKTNNKYKPNKMFKINNQAIYNGSLHKHARAIVMSNMHSYIINELDKQKLNKLKPKKYPIQLVIRIYTVRNNGNIRWSSKNNCILWNKPTEDYVCNWDEDNLRTIWEKAIKDSLSEYGFWSDDNVSVCKGVDALIEFVDDIEDRRIEISFKEL